MSVQVALFDHVTRPAGVSLADLYDHRMELAQRAERAGVAGYFLAEHHGHELSMSCSQMVLLAALARETTSLRLGTMVACLPLHHPIRFAEEVCMVDQLSHGRLELGVGRGIAGFEHEFFGHHSDDAAALYGEQVEMLLEGLTAGRINSAKSKYFEFPEIALTMETYQQPHPPLWYAGNLHYAAQHRMSAVAASRVTAEARSEFDQLLGEYEGTPDRLSQRTERPRLGSRDWVYVAESDEEAAVVGGRAFRHLRGMMAQSSAGSIPPHLQGVTPAEMLEKRGKRDNDPEVIAGSPETICANLEAYASAGNVDLMLLAMSFGDLSLDEITRSTDLLFEEVLPSLQLAG